MATASATLSPVNFTVVAPTRSSTTTTTTTKVTYIKGLNSFGGLKAHNAVASLGSSVSTEQQFANIVCELRKTSSSGGALTSTCSAVAEIFRIAAIMNGITLVGVAIGFVLLRIEASVEEAE
ncbi:putative PetM of cytochrome b6/f complex subunit 7 [Helianthus debilis subsp. tardiflorus]